MTLIFPDSSPGQEYHILSPKTVPKENGTTSCPHCQPIRTQDTGKRQHFGQLILSLSPLGNFIRAKHGLFCKRRVTAQGHTAYKWWSQCLNSGLYAPEHWPLPTTDHCPDRLCHSPGHSLPQHLPTLSLRNQRGSRVVRANRPGAHAQTWRGRFPGRVLAKCGLESKRTSQG